MCFKIAGFETAGRRIVAAEGLQGMFMGDAATGSGPNSFDLIKQVRNQDRGWNKTVVANVPTGIAEYQSIAS